MKNRIGNPRRADEGEGSNDEARTINGTIVRGHSNFAGGDGQMKSDWGWTEMAVGCVEKRREICELKVIAREF